MGDMFGCYFICLLSFFGFVGSAFADENAIGRLENSATGETCSASLIAPDLVLTAAHCVGALRNIEGDVDTEIVFRASGRAGSKTFVVSQRFEHPLYRLPGSTPLRKLRFDMALFELAEPVPQAVAVPLATGPEANIGEVLYLISWRANRPAPPRQRACTVIGGAPNLVSIACDVKGGESGAPLLRKTEAGLEVVAVLSSRFRVGEQPVGLASNVAQRLPPLLDLIDALDGS